jgi:hypothetical protein
MGMKSETPETVLPTMIRTAIEQAQDGDAQAWGRLYLAAARYMADGVPIPEPVHSLIGQRLAMIASALLLPENHDTREGLLDTVAPMPKGKKRKKGARNKVMTLDKVGIDAHELTQVCGVSLKEASRKLASRLATSDERIPRYNADSIESAAKRFRKQLKLQENNKSGE